MFFNSIEFALFLPFVFFLYWFVAHRNLKTQNLLIVCASYFFYGWWDWRFLSLIFLSTIVDFQVGKQLEKQSNPQERKVLLWTSIGLNIGMLAFFKYSGFFVESFVDAFSLMGVKLSVRSLNIVLPVGISFYTFQTLSYTIDIYKRKLKPTTDFISFMAFVSFFPQLVAGPIERAKHLLPQFEKERTFAYDNAVDGLRQILWGLCKKMIIADNAAAIVNLIYGSSTEYGGSTLLLGTVLFAFQIYGDFSGYSDIAIGTARLFGFDLMQNFNYPYFSKSISEFWRRWHISLSTWFRDYVYIPLGGSRGSKAFVVRNTIIVFVISGFWHGANWTFIIWGLLNALFIIPSIIWNHKKETNTGSMALLKSSLAMIGTFLLITFSWIFFRAESIGQAFQIVREVFSSSLFTSPPDLGMGKPFFMIFLFLVIEWKGRKKRYAIEQPQMPTALRWCTYIVLLGAIALYAIQNQQFIYFQF